MTHTPKQTYCPTHARCFLEQSASLGLSLQQCLQHCQEKVFSFHLSFAADPEVYMRRVLKYIGREWICVSTLPPAAFNKLTDAQRSFCMTHY